jgi:uncharacterized protein (TIGR03437 family)
VRFDSWRAGSRLVLALLVLGGFSNLAQATYLATFSHTWTGTEATQTNRLFRDGFPPPTWSTPKAFPGLFTTAPTTHGYFIFTLNVGAENFIHMDFAPSNVQTTLAVYQTSYNPAAQTVHYLSDPGASAALSFQMIAAPNEPILIVGETTNLPAAAVGASFTVTVQGFVAPDCLGHTTHFHISTVPPTHSGTSPHSHHNQHQHVGDLGCPSHSLINNPGSVTAPGGANDGKPATLSAALVAPTFVAGLNEDGSLNGVPGLSDLPGLRAAPRGTVVQLFGSAAGLFMDEPEDRNLASFRPPASGSPLYYTTSLPAVLVGGVPAKVMFSGLAPGLEGAWQLNVLLPEGVPTGTIPVTIVYEGEELGSIPIQIE